MPLNTADFSAVRPELLDDPAVYFVHVGHCKYQ